MEEDKEIVKKEERALTNSERFTNSVMTEFIGNVGGLDVNEYQKQLIRGYFIGIDNMLKASEERRTKNDWTKKENELPYDWRNVNLNTLALAVVHHAKLGLDMQIPNHLNAIPYKNKKTNKYEVTFIKGYKGLEYISTKHSLYSIDNIVTELIYETDEFEIISENGVSKYKFNIKNPFNRGNIIGGFGYVDYTDKSKNKLIILTKEEIDKRKPKSAAAEFWGGEKDVWENKKKVGTEKIDGWYKEMARKTIERATYNSISIDPQKVNDSYKFAEEMERHSYENAIEVQVEKEVEEKQASEELDFDLETGEITESTEIEETATENEEKEAETYVDPFANKNENAERPDWLNS